MAIVEMKKLTLLAMEKDKVRLVRQMQRMGCVQISPMAQEEAEKRQLADQQLLSEKQHCVERLDEAIARIGKLDTAKKPLFAQRPVADGEQVAKALSEQKDTMQAVTRNEEILRKHGELKAEAQREGAQIQLLTPWKGLGIPLEQVKNTQRTCVSLYTVPEMNWQQFTQGMAALPVAPGVQEASRASGLVYCLVAYHVSCKSEAEQVIKDCGASAVVLSGVTGAAEDAIVGCETRIANSQSEEKQLAEEEAVQVAMLPEMKLLRDAQAMELEQMQAQQMFSCTKSTFLVSGWIPSEKAQMLETKLKAITPYCEVEFETPTDDEKPPTLLHNSKFVSPFEAIINLYSLPDYHGIDATKFLTPFYICFFGFMVSDAGYGLTMALLAALYVYFAKPRGGIGQIAKILIWGGLGTAFWGVMFGGWFGVSTTPIIVSPLNQPVETMGICLVLGYIHIFFGMGLATYMNIKRGKIVDALVDQGCWYLILLGAPMLALPQTAAIGKWMALIGVAGLLLFGARDKKNIFGRLLGGAGKLYSVTSYLGDILSYVRLFGMGLATGVIGMVVNLIAGMVMKSPIGFLIGVVVLLIGHSFNLGINALGAYVNACRLQYIEFFSKFYEDGGTPFTPLKVNTRYVDFQLKENV